jgi:hypothetical protein
MQQKGWTDYNKLFQYFVTAADTHVVSAGKTVTHWNDVFDASLTVPANTIYQVRSSQ